MGGGLCKGPLWFKTLSSVNRSINCFYCNARSVKNKLIDLHDILYCGLYNIVTFSETWLSPIMTDGLLDPRGLYNIYRKDRGDGYGGVCIFVLSRIQSSVLNLDTTIYADVELIACRVVLESFI